MTRWNCRVLAKRNGWAIYAGVAAEWRAVAGARASFRGVDHRPLSAPPRPAATDQTARDADLARVEAALFAADEPLPPRRLAKLADLADAGQARRLATRLDELLDAEGAAFRVVEIAGGYQLMTRPELRPLLDRYLHADRPVNLSPPALEVLAVVAYRQPVCRADVEAIRGVGAAEVLKQLLDRGLIRLSGRDESLGRPFLYSTSKKFLRTFGLRSLSELPMVEQLASGRPTANGDEVGS